MRVRLARIPSVKEQTRLIVIVKRRLDRGGLEPGCFPTAKDPVIALEHYVEHYIVVISSPVKNPTVDLHNPIGLCRGARTICDLEAGTGRRSSWDHSVKS